jgi:N-acetylmuramoyl-L-alanine amidase
VSSSDAAVPRDAGPVLSIIDRPIRFDAERIRLALEYRRIHSDPAADDLEIAPRMIIIHHTGGNSAEGSWRYFNRVRIERARSKLASAGAVNVAAHFLIDRDGTCYRLMPETWMGRHAVGYNHIAIGVENVGDGKRYPLTDDQLAANAKLVRYLASRHAITHVVGHHETHRMENHAYFVEKESGYRNRKSDPGPEFMARLRDEIADLRLEGPPVE